MKVYFPKTIDKPIPFLFWEVDDLAAFILPVIISMPFKELIIGVVAGVILMKFYGSIKNKNSENFLIHKTWQLGFLTIKKTPPAHIRKFYE